MSNDIKEVTYTARVEFGDCDPAGIVWFPNFFRWIDAASRHFFAECGVPSWEKPPRRWASSARRWWTPTRAS
jgi:4-hydroxybenzoyl-CoA thioesterase